MLPRTDRRVPAFHRNSHPWHNRPAQNALPSGPSTSAQHDGLGNLTQVTDDLGNVKYGYDSTNFLSSVTDQSNKVTTYTPDSRDNRHIAAFPNGTMVTKSFDNSNRVTEIKATSSNATVLEDLTYVYLKSGTTDTNLRYSATDHVANTTTTYTYDGLDRLTEATTTGGAGSDYKYSYNNSNLCRTDGAACDPSTDPYQYNAANELTSLSGVAYGYDANGSVTTIGSTQTFAYNAQQQMTTSTVSGTPTAYVYSGNGQNDRLQAGSATFRSTQLGVDYQNDASGTTHYVRDNRGNLLEEVLPNGTHEHYLFDAIGSVRGLTDGGPSSINSYNYDPYGNLTSSSGTTANPWKYTSSFNDMSTGFAHMGARYYASTSQRRTSIDPVNNPSDTHGWNRYMYAGEDPVNYSDPSGLFDLFAFAGSLGIVSTGFGIITAAFTAGVGLAALAVLPFALVVVGVGVLLLYLSATSDSTTPPAG